MTLKDPAKLGKVIQNRFNSYSELKGSAEEMQAVEAAVAEMVVAAKIATGQEISLNKSKEFQAAATRVQSQILKVLSR